MRWPAPLFVGAIAIAGGSAAIVLALPAAHRRRTHHRRVRAHRGQLDLRAEVLPSFEATSRRRLAAVLKERATPDDLIVTYNVALPSLVYYLRRHIDVFYDHGPVLELLRTGRPLFLMAVQRRLRARDQASRIRAALPRALAADLRREAEKRAVAPAAAGGPAADEQVRSREAGALEARGSQAKARATGLDWRLRLTTATAD